MAEPTEFADFCSPAYRLETVNSASSRMVNCFPEVIEKGPRTGKLRLKGAPGFKRFCTLPDKPLRGLLSVGGSGKLWAVAGASVFLIQPDGTFKKLDGQIAMNARPVTMAADSFKIAIASGGFGYIVRDDKEGVVPLSFADNSGPLPAATIDYLDQYFIASVTGQKNVYVSNLSPDTDVWDPGDVKLKEGHPDAVSRVYADNQQLWVFGFDSAEPWVDQGGLFPFERQGVVLRVGCDAPYSLAGAKGFRFWLWRGVVYGAFGAMPERVSDFGVEKAIEKYGYTADAEAWCYTAGGHTFYVLTFPSAGRTWVYDAGLKAWHERLHWQNGQWSRYRARCYARAFNDLDLVGDSETGDIWQLDSQTFTDADGAPLRRLRTAPYICESMRNIPYKALILDMETGIGLPVAEGKPGADPQIIMRYSWDRGKTFSNDRMERVGAMGETTRRVIFKNCGASRLGMAFEVVYTEPTDFVVNTAYIRLGTPEAGR